MENIKMVDLQNQYLRIKPEIDSAIQKVIDSAAFIQGPSVHDFSKSLAKYNKVNHVITCGNGTDALQIALMALDLNPGDEVILPVHTYVATAEVIALLRLTPVFIDVNIDDFNIDVNQIESKITPRTKVIVPVHLYGQCADMEAIIDIADKHSLYIIEDAAQAIGASYTFKNGQQKMAGAIGTIGCTSFFPSKNLGCFGDGGALYTSNLALADKIKMIANHGQQKKYYHDLIGVNSRLDTIQAALLNVKLQYLDDYCARRQAVADLYDKAFKNLCALKTPIKREYSSHVFNQYTLKINEGSRDELKKYLAGKGIPTMIYYPVPLHMQKAYKQSGLDEGAFPIAEELSKKVISLPIHTEMSVEQIDYICDTVVKYF